MKLVFWAVAIVAAYFLYEYTVGVIFRDYQRCYESTIDEVSSIDGSPNNQCVMRKLIYTETNNCIVTVQKKGNFAGFLYQATSVKANIERDYFTHNEQCPSHRMAPPKESFYL